MIKRIEGNLIIITLNSTSETDHQLRVSRKIRWLWLANVTVILEKAEQKLINWIKILHRKILIKWMKTLSFANMFVFINKIHFKLFQQLLLFPYFSQSARGSKHGKVWSKSVLCLLSDILWTYRENMVRHGRKMCIKIMGIGLVPTLVLFGDFSSHYLDFKGSSSVYSLLFNLEYFIFLWFEDSLHSAQAMIATGNILELQELPDLSFKNPLLLFFCISSFLPSSSFSFRCDSPVLVISSLSKAQGFQIYEYPFPVRYISQWVLLKAQVIAGKETKHTKNVEIHNSNHKLNSSFSWNSNNTRSSDTDTFLGWKKSRLHW